MKNFYPVVFFSFLLLVFILLSAAKSKAQSVIYVNHAATGANTGESWADAYTDLQDALFILNANTGDTIWVAAGTYTPDDPAGSPFTTFLIDRDLVLLGGFAGTETSPDERDPETNITILSGDLNGDDIADDFQTNRNDNVKTVITINANIADSTLIDGFTIQGGHANGPLVGKQRSGGGIYSRGTPVIRNCEFTHNYALDEGGALYQSGNSSSAIMLDNCHFNNNSAEGGMAVHVLESLFDIQACTFRNNVDHGGPFSGSALAIIDPFGGTVRNCTFENNQANFGTAILVWRRKPNDPGDVLVEILDSEFSNNTANYPANDLGITTLLLVTNGTNSSFVVKGCTFNENESLGSGGAISINYNPVSNNASMLIDSCEFHMNTAQFNGSALWARLAGDNLNLEISNCQFLQNTTSLYSAAVDLWGTSGGTGTALVNNCLFEGNIAGAGGGAMWMGNAHNGGASVDFSVKNSVFRFNEVSTSGGAIALSSGSNSQTDIIIEDCEFSENKSDDIGGALRLNMDLGNAFYQIKSCTFNGNESPKGGAIYARKLEAGSGEILIENSLIVENSSDSAAIFLDTLSNLTLLNTTIANNQASGVEIANGSSLRMQNTILYNPDFTNFADITAENTIISYGGNLIGDGSFAEHAIAADLQNEDPLFHGSGEDCKYFEPDSPDSPLVDAGVTWQDAPDGDLCGNLRVYGEGIDIGAVELITVSNKEVLAGEIALSPNPASDFLNVQLPENVHGSFTLQLFDMQGRLWQQKMILSGNNIDVATLPAGVYTIKVLNSGKVYSGRFIKT